MVVVAVRHEHRIQPRHVAGADRELDHHLDVKATEQRIDHEGRARLLIENPAMPSHRRTVPSRVSNASAPNGWLRGALAWSGMAGQYRELKGNWRARWPYPCGGVRLSVAMYSSSVT